MEKEVIKECLMELNIYARMGGRRNVSKCLSIFVINL